MTAAITTRNTSVIEVEIDKPYCKHTKKLISKRLTEAQQERVLKLTSPLDTISTPKPKLTNKERKAIKQQINAQVEKLSKKPVTPYFDMVLSWLKPKDQLRLAMGDASMLVKESEAMQKRFEDLGIINWYTNEVYQYMNPDKLSNIQRKRILKNIENSTGKLYQGDKIDPVLKALHHKLVKESKQLRKFYEQEIHVTLGKAEYKIKVSGLKQFSAKFGLLK